MKLLFVNLPCHGHVIPFVSDQPVNAKQVRRLALGKIPDYKSISSATLKAAISSVFVG